MTASIETLLDGDVLRLNPSSDLVASSVEQQRTEMLSAIEVSAKSLVLDLSSVEQVDSLGISLVAGLFKTCQAKGLEFSVEGANANILRVFKLFKLPHFFPVKGA
jgi:anti-anti-sigma factor